MIELKSLDGVLTKNPLPELLDGKTNCHKAVMSCSSLEIRWKARQAMNVNLVKLNDAETQRICFSAQSKSFDTNNLKAISGLTLSNKGG